jgi:3-oxoacyl-[acyl-carrier protein] reductase
MPEPRGEFAGRTAVVTGGSRGIGAGIAIALAARGAQVVINGRDQMALSAVADAIKWAGGKACTFVANMTDEAAVQALREQAERVYGPVSLLAVCAGGGGDPKPLVEESVERWRNTVEVNLTSAFLTLRTFLPPMLEAGRGAIITIGSTAGRQLSGASAPYAAAKAGLLMLTLQAAAEAAPHGVRINAIAPSAIVTDRLAAVPEVVRTRMADAFPLRRLGEVEDVVQAALFLMTDRSSWITGVTLDVAGGRVMV